MTSLRVALMGVVAGGRRTGGPTAMRLPTVRLVTAIALVFAVPLAAMAQSVGRPYRAACVWAVPAGVVGPYRAALEQRLRELGWIEGQNIVFEHRFPDLPTDIPGLAEKAVKTRPDVIVATTNRAIEAAARATSTIPIVMMWGHDPIGSGFALSMARPGKNVTGLTPRPPPGDVL